MSTVSAWVLVDRPIMDVYRFVTDVNQMPSWIPLYSNTTIQARDGDRNVTCFDATLWLGLVPVIARAEVVDRVPGRRVSYRTMFPYAQTATYEFEPSSKGTVVTATHRPWSWSLFSPWDPIIRPLAGDVLNQTLLSLKREVEARSTVAPEQLIFFSYRREGTEYVSGRICEALSQEFGRGAVFRDIDAILPGGDAGKAIPESLDKCRVVVALIGPRWGDILQERWRQGQEDVLRRELEWTIEHEKRLIPVLVHDAQFPKDLPPKLEPMRTVQRLRLRPDPDFESDIAQVIRSVWDEIGKMGFASPETTSISSAETPIGVLESLFAMWRGRVPR